MIAERQQAKLDKDYARADAIRTELEDRGVALEDSREGTSWRHPTACDDNAVSAIAGRGL